MENIHRQFFENFVKVSDRMNGLSAIYLINISSMKMMRKIYSNIHFADHVSSLLNHSVPLMKRDRVDVMLFDSEELVLAERIDAEFLTVITMKKDTKYGEIFTIMKNIKKEISGGEDVRRQN